MDAFNDEKFEGPVGRMSLEKTERESVKRLSIASDRKKKKELEK